MKQLLLAGLSLVVFFSVRAQKKVLEYPFQIEKRALEKGEWGVLMQHDLPDSSGFLVLKNNEKASFVCLDNTFSVKGNIEMAAAGSAVGVSGNELVGSRGKGGRYELFFYNTYKLAYTLETVDFNTRTVVDKPSLELAPDDRFLAHFNENNNFYVLAADDKAGQLVLYTIGPSGSIDRKSGAFTIPADAARRDRISGYLSELNCVADNTEYDPILGTQAHKLFYRPKEIRIVVNDRNAPTHVITVSLPDCQITDKKINGDAGSSWLFGDRLFSLSVTKEDLTVFAHDPATGQLLKKFVISADAGAELLAEPPKYEKWNHKLVSSKEQDAKTAVRAFSNDMKSIWVTRTKEGRLMVMACTFDLSVQSSRWSAYSGPATHGGFQPSSRLGGGNPSTVWVPNSVTPTFSTTLSYVKLKPTYRWYGRTDVRLLLDPATLTPLRGKTPRPVADEVEDFVTADEKKKKTPLGAGDQRWVGYYNADTRHYVIEEVEVHN